VEIELIESVAMADAQRAEVLELCAEAYGENLTQYLADAGPGFHLLGRVRGILVSHAMVVSRTLQLGDGQHLRTAYVELVATHSRERRRGYASEILRELAGRIDDFDIGALAPSDEAFYARLGWETWRGALLVRTETGLVPTPDEQLMVLRLPRTPPALRLDQSVSIEWRPGEVW